MDYVAYISAFFISIFVYIWIKALQINRHWKKLGIPGPKPLPFVGNMLPTALGQKSIGLLFKEMHEAYPNEPVVGYYFYMQPGLLIRDPDLIDKCFITDFQHFTSRFGTPDITKYPLNSSLFFIQGNIWRAVRGKFTPMFTSGKLKIMFPRISSISDKFIGALRKQAGKAVDVGETIRHFAINVFASTGFGLEPTSAINHECEFTKRASDIIPPNFSTFLRFTIRMSHPSLTNVFNMNFSSQKTTKYYTDIVKEALEQRRTTGAVRNDFVQQMLSIQQKGFIEVEQQYLNEDLVPGMKLQPTDDLLAGQAFGFFSAGFDTVYNVLTCLIHDIALNADKQEKIREEIKRIVQTHGQISYDSLKDMEYLDACIKESLRLHSNVSVLWRLCTKAYKVPGVNCMLTPNNGIMVSTYAIHMDPKIYPEPERFIPERWLGFNKTSSNTFLSWGYGPRICIGMQLATVEMKSMVAKLLSNFTIKLHPSFQKPLEYNPKAFFNIPNQKILVDLIPL